MTAQVIGLIHWQALKLRFAGVPYPASRSPTTGRTSHRRFRDNVRRAWLRSLIH